MRPLILPLVLATQQIVQACFATSDIQSVITTTDSSATTTTDSTTSISTTTSTTTTSTTTTSTTTTTTSINCASCMESQLMPGMTPMAGFKPGLVFITPIIDAQGCIVPEISCFSDDPDPATGPHNYLVFLSIDQDPAQTIQGQGCGMATFATGVITCVNGQWTSPFTTAPTVPLIACYQSDDPTNTC